MQTEQCDIILQRIGITKLLYCLNYQVCQALCRMIIGAFKQLFNLFNTKLFAARGFCIDNAVCKNQQLNIFSEFLDMFFSR